MLIKANGDTVGTVSGGCLEADVLERAKKESPGRMEIERNIRIISTLKEGANDFLIKEGKMEAPEEKKEAKKPVAKKTPVKKPDVKKEHIPKADEEKKSE